jgi:NTE family protein
MSQTKAEYRPKSALLLGGGGARAAYQVGVLKAVSELCDTEKGNPFPIICGTSAGSINALALASFAHDFQLGVNQILGVWSNFKVGMVFKASARSLTSRIFNWAWSNLAFGNPNKGPSSLLDNSPLKGLLQRTISFKGIESSLENGHLHAYCVTACSYTTGESTTFYDGHEDIKDWHRTHRDGRRRTLNIDHLMASSAIPVIFPSVPIGNEHFGDGSMRQGSPISPALHLGADKILIIGLRIASDDPVPPLSPPRPSLGQISGYVMDTLFLNSLRADLERLERINRTLENGITEGRLTDETGELKIIEHMLISPSEDIANIAQKHYNDLPRSFRIALRFLGMKRGNSRRLISYLMFTKHFCKELIELGYNDAMSQQEELKAFLDD